MYAQGASTPRQKPGLIIGRDDQYAGEKHQANPVVDEERRAFTERKSQRLLIQGIKDGLAQGGMVVYETFIVDQAQFGKPKNPDYLLKHNELLEMFHSLRCLYYREGIVENRRATASIIAQKI